MFLSFSAMAQNEGDSANYDIPEIGRTMQGIGADLNFTSVDKDIFFGTRITPDISIGKFGFGLDIPLLINLKTGKLRIDEYTDGVGALRMIDYIRWGVKKRDPFYFRIGVLRDAQLGFGMLISDYTNSISFDKRKLGAEFDLVIKKKFGLEVIYSDLNVKSFNLFGIRPYYKPFGASGIPIIKSFEIGLGFVTDHDRTYLVHTDSIAIRNNLFLQKGINSFSADMGFWIFNWKFLRWDVYAQAAYIPRINSDSLNTLITNSQDPFLQAYKSGMGWSIGSDFNFHFLGNLLKVNFRAERFWHSDYFVPRFYSFAYELDKDYSIIGLINSHQDHGMYMKLGISVLDKIILRSNIIFPDKFDSQHPAEMYIGIDLSNLTDKLIFTTTMYQADVKSLEDIIKFRDETMFETLLAWRIYEVPVIKLQFIAGVDFKWTYALLSTMDFSATKYFSPFFKINFPVNETGQKSHTEENVE